MSWRSADEQVEYKSSDLSELSARNREMDEEFEESKFQT